jgi:hypothetical protein
MTSPEADGPEAPLKAGHFNYFVQPQGSRDAKTRESVREVLVELWTAIRAELSDPDSRLLGEIYAGPLESGSDNAWAQTNRDDEHQDVVNLTLELTAEELQLNLVGSTTPQREQLENWLRAAGSAFWRAHPEWELVVFIREARGKGFWMKAPWRWVARYSADEMSKKGIVSVRSKHGFGLDPDKERLAYHVGRRWARTEVESNAELLATLTRAVQEVLPALRQARNT